ncbi:MAG: ECF transporter S component [Firmicutes bacterium]|nr:ECF transporter S component [Bacillota bacterium]
MTDSKTGKLVLTALMMALTLIATMFIRVPIPFTQGYVHLGDAMVFMSALVLGRNYGIVAGGIGTAMADVLGGFAIWAPWTFVLKSLMVIILGTAAEIASKQKENSHKAVSRVSLIIGMIIGGAVMTFGYYIAEGVIYGSFVTALLAIPWNVGQFVTGMILAMVLEEALSRTQARKIFTYHI